MTGTDPIAAIVDQLAAPADQLTRLDTRHADHHASADSGWYPSPSGSGWRGAVSRASAAACSSTTWPRAAVWPVSSASRALTAA